jgi:hypothetical protein
MPILNTASVEDLKLLLDLYPLTSLKEQWPTIKGLKDEICLTIAGKRNIKEITEFLDEYISCCKQHIYVFSYKAKLSSLPTISIPDAEKVLEIAGKEQVRMLYVIRLKIMVVLREPLEEVPIEFLWPVRLDFTGEHLIVRFVVLEKNVGSYVGGRQFYTTGRSLDEKAVLQELQRSFRGGLIATDLHKGVKKLWDTDFMDATRTQYKKSLSTASEIMDEERGIKKFNPDLYAVLKKSLLFKTLFQVSSRELSVTAFSVDPSNGDIGFPRYSDNKGDTDYVVDEILRHN